MLDHAPLVLRARVTHTGLNFTISEVAVEDALGRPVMHVTGSVVVREADTAGARRIPDPQPVTAPVYPTPDPYLRPLPPGVGPLPGQLFADDAAIKLFQRILAGDLPAVPVWEILGVSYMDVSEGGLVASLRASEWLCTHTQQVQAGVMLSLAVSCLSGAALSLSPPGRRIGIIDQSVSLFRPVPADGREVLSRGRVVHHDGDLVHSTVEATDADGRRVAMGHQTSLFSEYRGRRAAPPERVLATVLFTDIVGSTGHAERLGDAKWRESLDDHHALVRRQLQAFKGREVKTTGDGFLAAFDSPARAVQCARAIRDGVARLGIEIRAGLHSGECEVVGADLAGIAVHVASRVQAAASAGEVLVSSTVRDLVAGSGLRFTDRGRHTLKGLEGDWHLFAVED
jgi:class 3 adenylate cyclase